MVVRLPVARNRVDELKSALAAEIERQRDKLDDDELCQVEFSIRLTAQGRVFRILTRMESKRDFP